MLIGIFSDVHDNIANLRNLLALYAARDVSTLIFCGDFCSPIPAREMGAFEGTIHAVFGNGDGDRFTMLRVVETVSPNLALHGEYAELDLGGQALAVTHYPFYARALAHTRDYRAVFCGHTHEWREEHIGACLVLNPGEVLGWKGPATAALYDTSSGSVEKLHL